MGEKNRRLILGDDIIYPFTKQENVIGLQKTIKDKLPIVSDITPENYVEKQVWIDTSEHEEELIVEQPLLSASPNIDEEIVSYQLEQPEEIVSEQLEEPDGTEVSSQLEPTEEIVSTQLEQEQPSAQIEDESGLVISTTLEN